ncbi:hypothetical protein ILYODFUR_007342 [Ilyodon furcidens]|uniref:Uncharacterized protein n=1 Tax=Ilyodon furcidens TaxID=33524 RepID=A0ABV0VDF5_9TELE
MKLQQLSVRSFSCGNRYCMRCPIESWDGQAVSTFCARLTLDKNNLQVKMFQKFKEGSQTLAALIFLELIRFLVCRWA